MFLKEQPERDSAIKCERLHVNMQIQVCVYNMETKHLMRLDLIHLSLLHGHHLRGYWMKSHKNASDSLRYMTAIPQRWLENNDSLELKAKRIKFVYFYSLFLTALLKQQFRLMISC